MTDPTHAAVRIRLAFHDESAEDHWVDFPLGELRALLADHDRLAQTVADKAQQITDMMAADTAQDAVRAPHPSPEDTP